ncbi:hypothetical protein, partial [Flavobacterium aurantiibacter]
LIMDEKKFNELKAESKNGVIEHNVAEKNSIKISRLGNTYKNMQLFQKIVTHISKTLNKYYYDSDPTSKLARGTIEISSLVQNKKTSSDAEFLSKTTYGDHQRFGDTGSLITMNFDLRKELNTAPNIFSLFEHEFHGHGGNTPLNIKIDRSDQYFKYYQHKAIYQMQSKTENFKNVSKPYRKHVLDQNKAYGN